MTESLQLPHDFSPQNSTSNISSTHSPFSSNSSSTPLSVVVVFSLTTFFGLIGNLLIIVVLLKEAVRRMQFFPYLFFMAVSDGITITIQLSMVAFDWWPFNQSAFGCRLPSFIFGVFGGASNVLVLLVTLDRCVAVYFPRLNDSETRCLEGRSRRYFVILAMFFFLFSLNLPFAIIAEFDAKRSKCSLPSEDTPWAAFYLCFRVLVVWIPLVVVAVGNATIAIWACRRRRLLGFGEKDKNLVVVVVVIASAYVILEFPAAIRSIALYRHAFFVSGFPVAKFFCQVNHSVNFYLYAIPCGAIRDEIKSMFLGFRLRSRSSESRTSLDSFGIHP